MVDWLHCNTCYIQPGQISDGRMFFLTSCGHIFCEKCQEMGWVQKCLVCGTATPSSIKLTSKLTPPVDAYFADPVKMMQQVSTNVKQMIATRQFQDDQRLRLMKWLRNKFNATDKAEQNNDKLSVLERENGKLREEINYLKKLLEEKLAEINYFKRLLSEKSPGNTLRSPSGDRVISPVQRAFGRTPSPVSQHPNYNQNMTSSLSSYRKSPSNSSIAVTQGRVSVRLPPSGCRIGMIPSPQNRTPTSKDHGMASPMMTEAIYTPRPRRS